MAEGEIDKVKVYEAIQRGISETDDISFKLISFVPLISGAGLLTIRFGGDALPKELLSLLSLFAAAITVGLFWWELWNIQTCHWLMNLAAQLEAKVLDRDLSPPKPPGIVGKHNAAKIIYATTIGVWLLLPMVTNALWLGPCWFAWLYVGCGLVVAEETVRALCASTHPSVPSTFWTYWSLGRHILTRLSK